MSIFSIILLKLIPLSLYIIIGYILGKRFKIDKESVGVILLYSITPCLFFSAISKAKITAGIVIFPIIIYVISCLLATAFNKISCSFQDNRSNLVAFSAGTGNTGYFGIPIAMELFDSEALAIYMTIIIGMSLYDVSFGYYVMACGKHSKKDSFIRATKIPTFYAFILGCVFSYFNIQIPTIFDEFFIDIRHCYIVLGMFMIGLGLASISNLSFDYKLLSYCFFAKFIVWPLLALSFIYLDKHFMHIYDSNLYDSLLLLSIVPMAGNSVILASIFNNNPEKIAATVLASIIFSIFFIPAMISWFMV